MSKKQDMGFTAADAAWLRGLTDGWDDKDAVQELDKCLATARSAIPHTVRMKVTASDIVEGRAPSPRDLNVTSLFMDLAEQRIYQLEKSENARDVRVGRAMAAELQRRFPE